MSMDKFQKPTAVMAIFLLLLAMMVLVPGSEAEGYEGTYDDIEILNNEYWAENIALWDSNDSFEFSVTEVDGRFIDVYIMNGQEFNNYKNDLPFETEYSSENIDSTGSVNWTCPDGRYYYLVVDNKKNAHLIDAYANENVFVDISWLNKTEQQEIEEAMEDLSNFGGFCCAIIVIIPISFLLIFLYLDRKGSGQISNRPPMFQYPQNGPPSQPPMCPPQFPPQAPSRQSAPPQYPPSGPSSQPHHPPVRVPPTRLLPPPNPYQVPPTQPPMSPSQFPPQVPPSQPSMSPPKDTNQILTAQPVGPQESPPAPPLETPPPPRSERMQDTSEEGEDIVLDAEYIE